MNYQPGQDITVTFDGIDHQGELEKIENGWYHCRITVDPCGDYGSITARLAPQSTVCVRAESIKPCATTVHGKNNL